MQKSSWLALGFLAATILVFLSIGSCTYVVDQRDYAIVTLFGEVKEIVQDPGLRFKNPLADVTTYPKLIQEYNKEPSNTITADKKNILISFYVKYRIDDVVKFAQTVRTKLEAEKRIDDVVYSNLKTTVSRINFDTIVVNRGDIERGTQEQSQKAVETYGIHLVDFRIKRTDLPQQILQSVYTRMTEERRQKAQLDRSEGEKLKSIMTAEASKRETQILSEAYKRKQELMGEGENQALKILEEAYGRDVEFATFIKTLDLYKESFKKEDTRLILSAKSEILQFLRGANPAK